MMKKVNNKGVTLIELVVSFAIVAVAIIYFYQTLYTVRRLFTTSQKETQTYVDKTYALRLAEAYCNSTSCVSSNSKFYEEKAYALTFSSSLAGYNCENLTYYTLSNLSKKNIYKCSK